MNNSYIKLFILFVLTPFLSHAVSIDFNVNMNHQIQQGNFSSSDPLDIAGTFNDWGGTTYRLTDADGDGIYSVTISGFSVGETIEFKFRRKGNWNGTEEFPGGGGNRRYTVQSGENNILVWYNDELPNDAPPQANVRASNTEVFSQGIIYFEDASAGVVNNRQWIFEGGNPHTATQAGVEVGYASAGTYDVTLIISNANASDTLVLEDYITIEERDREELEWWNDAVFYEIFVRSFYDSDGDGIGDFKGLTSQLDYLNDGDPNTTDDLGIKGIWLMPIHDSPSYHGYDVRNFRSIEPDYGTMEDFQEFLEEAHARGIRVIIDYVMNHTSHAHPWFLDAVANQNGEYRNWYRWSGTRPNYSGPWGQDVWHFKPTGYYYGLFWSGMPDLNYEEPAVQAEMFDIADFWLEDIGVDGFRLDAVKYIFEDGTKLEDTETTFQFWRDFRAHYKNTKPDAFTVGEAWTSTNIVRNYVEDEGLDYCFEFEVAGNIINAVNTGDARYLGNALKNTYSVYPHMQYGTFLSNHDQERIIETLGGNQSKQKAAAAIYLSMPGIPYVYYGEEIGMKGLKPDEFIRTPMQWTSGANGGFTTGSPWIDLNSNYTTFNVASQEQNPTSLLNWYKDLIHIRNDEVALRRGDLSVLGSSSSRILAFMREYEGETVLVLVNTSNSPVAGLILDVDNTNLAVQNYSVKELLSGANVSLEVETGKNITGISLSAYSTKMYKFDTETSTRDIVQHKEWVAYPNPVRSQLFVQTTTDAPLTGAHYILTDMQGKTLQSGIFTANQNRLQVSDLPTGNYILSCTREGLQQTFKFVKE